MIPARTSLLLLTQDYPPRPGGMSRYYADLTAGWGETSTVLCGSWKGDPPSDSGPQRVIELGLDANAAHRWRAQRIATGALRAALRSPGVGFVLAGNIRPYAILTGRAARAAKVPWGFAIHGTDVLSTARRWREHPWKKRHWRALSRADLIVANSRFTADQAAELGLAADRIVVVPPEIDTAQFRPAVDADEQRAEREHLGLSPDGLLGLFVGRLVARKGLSELFAALRVLPTARLAVVGSEPEPWIEEARRAGVADRVHFGGEASMTGDLPRWYRAADVFLGPSHGITARQEAEGFGIVFLEAAASGLPVIATRTGGIPEAVDAENAGILVPPGDVSALAAAWGRLLEDGAMRRRMAAAAPHGRPRDHDRGSMAARLARAVDELPGDRKRRRTDAT